MKAPGNGLLTHLKRVLMLYLILEVLMRTTGEKMKSDIKRQLCYDVNYFKFHFNPKLFIFSMHCFETSTRFNNAPYLYLENL